MLAGRRRLVDFRQIARRQIAVPVHVHLQALPLHRPAGRSSLPPDPSEQVRRQGFRSEEFLQKSGDPSVDQVLPSDFSDDQTQAQARGE